MEHSSKSDGASASKDEGTDGAAKDENTEGTAKDGAAKTPVANAAMTDDLLLSMLESDMVKRVDKSRVKKSKKFSKKDKAKIAEMVKGLSKYREYDDDGLDVHVSHKTEMKAPKSPKGQKTVVVDTLDVETVESKEDNEPIKLDNVLKLKDLGKSDALSEPIVESKPLSKKAKKKAAKLQKLQSEQVAVSVSESNEKAVSLSVSDQPKVVDSAKDELVSTFQDMKIGPEDVAGQEKPGKKKGKKNKQQKESVEARLRAMKATDFEDKEMDNGARPKSGKFGSYSQLLGTLADRKSPIKDGRPAMAGSPSPKKPKTPDRQLSPKFSVTLPDMDSTSHGKERRIITIQRSDIQQDKHLKVLTGKKASPQKGQEEHLEEQQQGPGKKKKNKKLEEKVSVAERLQSSKKKHEKSPGTSENLEDYRMNRQISTGSDKVDASQPYSRPFSQQAPMFHAMPIPQTDTLIQVYVPKFEHKYITGPGYSHIREIYNVTGISIEVPPPGSGSEMVVLRGNRQQAGAAVALMFSKSAAAQSMEVPMLVNDSPPIPTPLLPNQNYNKGQGQVRVQGQQHQGQKGKKIYEQANQIQAKKGHQGQGRKGSNDNGSHMGQQMVINSQIYKRGLSDPNMDRGHGHAANSPGKVKGHGRKTPDRDAGHCQPNSSSQKGQGKRARKNKAMFADYIPAEELSQGLKRGLLVQGAIRINPRNFEEAYVPHPDGLSDILICGLKERNRALNGDIVAVEVKQQGDWKMTHGDLKELEEEHTKNHEEDSDPEVVIEAEETVEVINSAKTNLTPSKDHDSQRQSQKADTPGQSPKKKSGTKGDNSSRNRFTSLDEVLKHGSPVTKRIFEAEDAEARKLLQRTGRVVSIIACKHSRACTGFIKPFPDKNTNVVLFSPSDHRVPRIKVPVSDCPQDFLERPEDHAKTLYVARITDWKQDSNYAEGCLAKSLGEAGEIEPETEGMLIENGIDFDDFPPDALACLPADLPWRIPAKELEQRRDFRSSCVFTIDPSTARDLDDALSCEDLGDGRFKVGVHIADVSYFVSEGNMLDKVAAFRATSVYLVHKVIPMLPRLLCEQLCSLNPDEDRLSFSVEWVISEDGEIEEEWFGRSVIRSCAKLSYDHAQGFISQPDREWTTDELPPISKGFTVQDIRTRVLNMHKIAKNLRQKRFDGGALRLDQVKLQFSLDAESGMPNGYSVYEQRDSNRLVEEFMLLANMAVAHKINQDFPDKAVLRRHPPPQEKMVETLKEQCSALGIHLDISSAGELQRTLWRYCGDDEYSQARMQVLVALCAKPMQNAKYFCTGCIDDEALYRHYALNVPLYTHFTSPIRRYPDVMVHRLLAAALEYSPEPSTDPREIHQLAEHCNDKKTAAKRVGDLSSELFFSVFVKTTGPLEEKAMVMGVLDKCFDIFVLRLGVSKRVYCDKLDIIAKTYRRDKKVPSLTLVWAVEEGEPSLEQEITIFTVVDCVLQQGDLPLQWTAVIKKPERQTFSTIPVMNLCEAVQDQEDDDIECTEDMMVETGTLPSQFKDAVAEDGCGLTDQNTEQIEGSSVLTPQEDAVSDNVDAMDEEGKSEAEAMLEPKETGCVVINDAVEEVKDKEDDIDLGVAKLVISEETKPVEGLSEKNDGNDKTVT